MKRVALQVNLDPRIADAVYRLGQHDGVSVAAVLRESVERYVTEREADLDPLDSLAGLWGDDGPQFDARDLDEELARVHGEASA